MKVATFYEPRDNRQPKISHIRAYTVTYNPSWKGCIVYDIDTKSGEEAKRQARSLRYNHELQNV